MDGGMEDLSKSYMFSNIAEMGTKAEKPYIILKSTSESSTPTFNPFMDSVKKCHIISAMDGMRRV